MEVTLKKQSVTDKGKTVERTFKSYRNEGNDTWEFINCGTHNDAVEVAKKVLEKYGKEGVVDFSSYGWFVRVRIEH